MRNNCNQDTAAILCLQNKFDQANNILKAWITTML